MPIHSLADISGISGDAAHLLQAEPGNFSSLFHREVTSSTGSAQRRNALLLPREPI
jgi:hypothetical protein